MIVYNRRSLLDILLFKSGSMLPALIPKMLVAFLIAIAAVAAEEKGLFLADQAHTYFGFLAGFLAIFRCTNSYQRNWWVWNYLKICTNTCFHFESRHLFQCSGLLQHICMLLKVGHWIFSKDLLVLRRTRLSRNSLQPKKENYFMWECIILFIPFSLSLLLLYN